MTDEFWDVVGSEIEAQRRVWKCRRFLDDCFEDETETVPVYDVVCGYAVTDQPGEDVKEQCSQCGLYQLKCTCEAGFLFCNMRGRLAYPGTQPRVSIKCPKAGS